MRKDLESVSNRELGVRKHLSKEEVVWNIARNIDKMVWIVWIWVFFEFIRISRTGYRGTSGGQNTEVKPDRNAFHRLRSYTDTKVPDGIVCVAYIVGVVLVTMDGVDTCDRPLDSANADACVDAEP